MFYGFSLERHVPANQMLRAIDRVLDLSSLRAANNQRSAEGAEPVDWNGPAQTRRSVRNTTATLGGDLTRSEVKPKFVSRSNQAAQRTGAMKGKRFVAYATNYLIDLDHAVIVDVEACRAIRQPEVGASHTMIERTIDRFGLWLARLDSRLSRHRD